LYIPPQKPSVSFPVSIPRTLNASYASEAPTGNVLIDVKKLMIAEPVAEGPGKPTNKQHSDEKEDRRVFSLYNPMNEDLVEFLLENWRNIRLSYIPQKEEKFKAFCKEYSIAIPDDMVSTAPFENGVGPRNGKNEMRSLSGYIAFKMPDNERVLEMFDRVAEGVGGLRQRIRAERKKGEMIGVLHDAKLILTLLATNGDEFRITKYPTEAGRTQRKP
jgi:hypothetical protein